MEKPEFLRPPYLAAGAVVAAVLGVLVPAEGPVSKLVMVVFAWGFCAYGAWSLRELWQVLAESARDIAAWRRRPATGRRVRKGPLPVLPPATQAQVREVVAVMAKHGLFKPEVPDPALLFAGLAENGGQARPDDILSAMEAVQSYHPESRSEAWTANLHLEYAHGEQDEEEQLEAFVALTDGALTVQDVRIQHRPLPGEPGRCQVRIRMKLQGQPVDLSYPGHQKYFSTHLPHALATHLAALGTGKRLACLTMGEQYAYSVLADGAVEALNQALHLGPDGPCVWVWADEQAPVGAGEEFSPPA